MPAATPLYPTVWGGGQLMAFSGLDGPTDYEHGLVAQTGHQGTSIRIRQPGDALIEMSDAPPLACTIGGDFFELQTKEGRVIGVWIDTHHMLIHGNCTVTIKSNGISGLTSANNQTLVGTTNAFKPDLLQIDALSILPQRKEWLEKQQHLIAPLPPETQRAAVKALSLMKTQVYTPEGAIPCRWSTPDRWPHRAMWLWDSVFHAIGFRHCDARLARELIDAVLSRQRQDGFIAHMLEPHRMTDITQPPVLALGIKLVHQCLNDPSWIEQAYTPLAQYLRWDLANRDSDGGGLCEWLIEGNPNCRSGESGMDNSSRFDSAVPLDATCFNSFLALECEILAEFATALGHHEDAAQWKAEHDRLCRLINEKMWNDESGFYFDYDPAAQQQTQVMASSGFLPLICGAPSQEQARRLAHHLNNEATFGTPLRVASIARCDSNNYSKDMWRGPVWVNMNWLVAYGLDRYGHKALASSLRRETMREIERLYHRYGAIFEFMDDRCELDPPQLLRKGKCAPNESPYHQAFFDFGWSATLYLDMCMADEVTNDN